MGEECGERVRIRESESERVLRYISILAAKAVAERRGPTQPVLAICLYCVFILLQEAAQAFCFLAVQKKNKNAESVRTCCSGTRVWTA